MKERVTGTENDFDDIIIVEVWMKAIPYNHFEIYKKDYYGSLMFFDEYGNNTDCGWVIEYIKPFLEGGTDEIANLRAVNWKNNWTYRKQEFQNS